MRPEAESHILDPLFDVIEIDDGVIARIDALGEEGRDALIAVASAPCETYTDVERGRAVYVLGQLGGRAAFGLFTKLLEDEAHSVRLQAITGIADVGGPNAAAPLLDIVCDAKRSDIERAHALDVLGVVGDEKTRQQIEEWSQDVESFELRKVACKAIADITRQIDEIARQEARAIADYCRQ